MKSLFYYLCNKAKMDEVISLLISYLKYILENNHNIIHSTIYILFRGYEGEIKKIEILESPKSNSFRLDDFTTFLSVENSNIKSKNKDDSLLHYKIIINSLIRKDIKDVETALSTLEEMKRIYNSDEGLWFNFCFN